MKFRFHCPQIKFYWHTATSIHWHPADGYLHTLGAKLSSYNRGHTAKAENINCVTLDRKHLQVPVFSVLSWGRGSYSDKGYWLWGQTAWVHIWFYCSLHSHGNCLIPLGFSFFTKLLGKVQHLALPGMDHAPDKCWPFSALKSLSPTVVVSSGRHISWPISGSAQFVNTVPYGNGNSVVFEEWYDPVISPLHVFLSRGSGGSSLVSGLWDTQHVQARRFCHVPFCDIKMT